MNNNGSLSEIAWFHFASSTSTESVRESRGTRFGCYVSVVDKGQDGEDVLM